MLDVHGKFKTKKYVASVGQWQFQQKYTSCIDIVIGFIGVFN